jgi:quercetin 2,3-dioxygenase
MNGGARVILSSICYYLLLICFYLLRRIEGEDARGICSRVRFFTSEHIRPIMAFGLFRKRTGAVLKTEPLGQHWDVEGPFVFCVRHRDSYPEGNAQQAPPLETIAGRNLGHDYRERLGFRMYQGKVVPGFPRHPHCSVETVTWAREGWVDFSDTAGYEGRYSSGDVHRLAAGHGIHHCEMFPLANTGSGNMFDMIQLWMAQEPAARTLPPSETMCWNGDAVTVAGDGWRGRVLAGQFMGGTAASPEGSWSADPENMVAAVSVTMEEGSSICLRGMPEGCNRNLYVIGGGPVAVDGTEVPDGFRAKVDASADIVLSSPGGGEVMILQGRPVPGRTVSYGPFFGSSLDEVRAKQKEALADSWGEWRWDVIDRVHGRGEGRFFKLPDGTVERPEE